MRRKCVIAKVKKGYWEHREGEEECKFYVELSVGKRRFECSCTADYYKSFDDYYKSVVDVDDTVMLRDDFPKTRCSPDKDIEFLKYMEIKKRLRIDIDKFEKI